MAEKLLTERVDDAINALETINVDAGKLDRRVQDAEYRAAEAEKQAEKDRQAKDEALGKVDGLEQEIIDTRASIAGEVETLKASNELLATRDREARDELERLRFHQARGR